jgi:hypothetical protein
MLPTNRNFTTNFVYPMKKRLEKLKESGETNKNVTTNFVCLIKMNEQESMGVDKIDEKIRNQNKTKEKCLYEYINNGGYKTISFQKVPPNDYGYKFYVAENHKIEGVGEIPIGFLTDGCTVLGGSIFPNSVIQKCILHDWLYATQEFSQENSDAIYYYFIQDGINIFGGKDAWCESGKRGVETLKKILPQDGYLETNLRKIPLVKESSCLLS